MIDVHVAVHGDDTREIYALQEWLRTDRHVGGQPRVLRKPIDEGNLGGLVDVLVVALGSSGAAVAFSQVLITWLRTRRPQITVTITVDQRSASFTVDDAKDGQAEGILKALLRIVDERPSS